jgi:hypothetical protein
VAPAVPAAAFGESGFELGRGDGRGHGQGDNLAHSALGSGVNAERLDRRRRFPGPQSASIFIDRLSLDLEVCICGFARHAGEVGRGSALALDNFGQKVDGPSEPGPTSEA